ncbi:hypothetical protein [Pseudomonas panipatensis]|uniref:hypothetical protein n=1 Tax=Pseudomonas panipatensis TaxID=428992 RepID=UPI0035AEBC06
MKVGIKGAAFAGFVMTLAGCVSQEEMARQEAVAMKTRDDYFASTKNTTVSCQSKELCEKAFTLTKVYVSQSSDMKVQSSDDTMIATYNPIDFGYVAVSATKVPDVGQTSKITLTAYCKGLKNLSDTDAFGDYFGNMCAKKMTQINNGFKGFVESKL